MAGMVVGAVVSSFAAEAGLVAALGNELFIAGIGESLLAADALAGALIGGSAAVATNMALGAVAAPDSPQPQVVGDTRAHGVLVNVSSNVAAIPVVYGCRRVGGAQGFIRVSDPDSEAPAVTEYLTVPATPPHTVTVAHAATWTRTAEVGTGAYSYDFTMGAVWSPSGTLTAVTGTPGPGQYAAEAGVYEFEAGQAGDVVAITYAYTVVIDNNAWLWRTIVLSEGQIGAIDRVLANDLNITAPRYARRIVCERYLGSDDQQASPLMVAALRGIWTAEHRGRGLAYLMTRCSWNIDAFPGGPPTFTADVRGIVCYDPRDGGTRFTVNPALVVRDYLTNTRYGRGLDSALLDDASFAAAADSCDARVRVPAKQWTVTASVTGNTLTLPAEDWLLRTGDGVRLSTTGALPGDLAIDTTYYAIRYDGGTLAVATTYANALAHVAYDILSAGSGTHTLIHWDEPAFSASGVVDTDQTVYANVQQLLTACNGLLIHSGGLYRLRIDEATAAETAFGFTEDNITGAWEIRQPGRRERWNRVVASWFNPAKNWQADYVVAESAAALAEDNGRLSEHRIDLPYTTSPYTAARIAWQVLKQSRAGVTVRFRAFQAGLRCEVGDVVPITHGKPGWTAKPFRILAIGIIDDDEVEITAQAYSADAYVAEDQPAAPDPYPSSLGDPLALAAPGVPAVSESLVETTGSSGVKARASVTWAAPADAWLMDHLLEYRAAGAPEWTVRPAVRAAADSIDDIAPGQYEFRVRSRNVLGVSSEYSGTARVEIRGLTAPPGDPTDFHVISRSGDALATWTQTADLDVKIGGWCVLRHSAATGATWAEGVVLDRVPGDATVAKLPLMAGTYLLKFQDSAGNWSETEASFDASEDLAAGYTTVDTLTEDPGFSGSKTACAVVGGELLLDGDETIDDQTDLMDDWGLLEALGNVVAAGTYEFSAAMDLATVGTRNFIAAIEASAFDAADTVDDRTATVDDWDSLDGTVVNDCDATLWIATTADDPAASPTWSAWRPFFVGDFTGRGFKFRLTLESGNPAHNIAISALQVRARTPA